MNTTINKFNNILDFNTHYVTQYKSDFRIYYHNIRSLNKKFEETELLITNMKIDLVILTETWITKGQKKFYNFNGYNSIYSCRQRQGGGLGIFIKNNLEYEILENYESEDTSYIIINLNEAKLNVFAIYRPPISNLNEFLNMLDQKINNLSINNNKCLIIGDLNINLLLQNNNTNLINAIYTSNNFDLCNTSYSTRYSDNRESLLDHIVINFQDSKANLDIIKNSLSDHAIQILSLNLSKKYNSRLKSNKITTKLNYKSLRSKLNILIERTSNENIDTDDLYDLIIDAFNSSMYNKTIKLQNNTKPWFNEKIYYLIKQRDYYFYRKKDFPDNKYIKNAYNNYNNLVKKR